MSHFLNLKPNSHRNLASTRAHSDPEVDKHDELFTNRGVLRWTSEASYCMTPVKRARVLGHLEDALHFDRALIMLMWGLRLTS